MALGGERFTSPVARWWMVVVLSLAGLVSYTDRVILSALVDPIRSDLHISDPQVSLLQGAAFAIIYVLAGLPFGRLADCTVRIRLIIAGATTWCIGTIACGLAPSFGALFAARIVIGVGEAALAPAAISMIADAFPPARRGTAVGVFLTGMIVGGPAAVAIGGTLLSAGQGGHLAALPVVGALAPWRAVLVLVGTCGLLVPLACLTIAEPARTERDHGAESASVRDVVAGFARQRTLLVPLYLGLALLSIGDYGILSWTPTLLSRKFTLEPARIGAAFGMVSATGGILGSVLGGVLSDAAERWGGARARFAAVAIAAAVAAAGAVLMSAGSATAALAGLGIWTLASALGGTGGTAALGTVVPNEMRGVSISIMAFCNTLLGLGLGPTLVAVATERLFRDPIAVGLSMTAVVLPAGVLAAIAFGRSGRVVAHERRA